LEEEQVSASAEKMLLTSPEHCAADILKGIRRGRRILTGNKSTTMFWLARLLPNAYPRVLSWLK
jgi:short-subunit dehydrogenase